MPIRNPNGGAPPPPQPPAPPAPAPKKESKVWTALKYLLGGAALGIASYEGVRFYRKTIRGEQLDPVSNPGPGGPAMPAALPQMVPQMMPFPIPTPFPMPTMQPQAAMPPPESPGHTIVVQAPNGKTGAPQKLSDEQVDELLELLANDD